MDVIGGGRATSLASCLRFCAISRQRELDRRQGDRAEMFYDEMVDDLEHRKSLVEDLSPVSAKM